MTTQKTTALTIWTIAGKVVSLLFNMRFRFVIVLLPRSKGLLISWLQSLSAVILEAQKIKFVCLVFEEIISWVDYISIPSYLQFTPTRCYHCLLHFWVLMDATWRQELCGQSSWETSGYIGFFTAVLLRTLTMDYIPRQETWCPISQTYLISKG